MAFQAQDIPQNVLQNAYQAVEYAFSKSFERFHELKVPSDGNDFSSHIVYKIRRLFDDSLLFKTRITANGNNDNGKSNLRTVSASFQQLGFPLLLSL